MAKLPVVSVGHFQDGHTGSAFYASQLKPHIEAHAITRIPHKHDFYFVVFFTKGHGVHEIDFVEHVVKAGSLFIMRPGQMHVWRLSKDAEGYVIIHSGPFYEEGIRSVKLNDHGFFGPFSHTPVLQVKKTGSLNIEKTMKDLLSEYHHENRFRLEKIRALLTLLYIDLSRCDISGSPSAGPRYLNKLREFDLLLDEHYKNWHLPSDYAAKLNVSERHLNRITRAATGKSSSALIHEKIILEAKRLLTGADILIVEVSDALGFNDASYFSRFFARETGLTPSQFVKQLHGG